MTVKPELENMPPEEAAQWEAALAPIHPGEILLEEFLLPLGISQSQLAADLDISFRRVNEIVNAKRGITGETALLLARYFDVSPEFWLGLQLQFDLDMARGAIGDKIERIRPMRPQERLKAV